MIYTEANTDDRYLSGSITELKFKGFDGDCVFELHNLKVTDTIDYDEVALFINDEEFDPGTSKLTNWRGDTPDPVVLFDQVLNAYLREDFADYTFESGWDVFDKIRDFREIKDGLVILLPQYDGFEIIFYELDLAVTDGSGIFKYYIQDDLCLMLNDENEIETNEEFFFEQAYYEDTEAVLNGTKTAKYTGANWDLYVEAEFGQ